MHIGLFGGSFNPPHIAHLIVAEQIREQFSLDQIWWIPAFVPPHKVGIELASAEHRLEMTHLATQDNPAFVVNAIEVRRKGTSYTLDTVSALQDEYPEDQFSLIIGGDSLAGFGSWHRPDEIIRRVPLIIYRRPGNAAEHIEPRFASRARFAEAPLLEISSTKIRALCQQGRSVRYLVPASVEAFIQTHQIYVE